MGSSEISQIGALCLIHFLGVASPGPDFFITLRNSIRGNRYAGFLTALGIGVGNIFHNLLAISLTSTLMLRVPWLFELFKVGGAFFLFYLGFKSIRAFKSVRVGGMEFETESGEGVIAAPFMSGLVCCLLNAKAALYYFSVFTQFLSVGSRMRDKVFLLGILFLLITFFWFLSVSLFVRTKTIRQFLQNYLGVVDVAMGLILICFSVLCLMGTRWRVLF